MAFSPLTRYRLRQVFVVTIAWTTLGILLEIHNAVSFDPVNEVFFMYFPLGKTAFQHLLIAVIGPFVGGIFGGGLIIFVLRDRLRRKSFGQKLLIQSAIILGLISALIMLVGGIHALRFGGDQVRETFIDVVFNVRVLRLIWMWFGIALITILMLDIGEKYGKGVLWKILIGKYHRPLTEERIFMFLDLRNSTGLAESLGETRYFTFLRTFFYMATEPVLNSEGEIYQYVGDEIVLSWTMSTGLRDANCIRCFFRIREAIEKGKPEFMQQFGVIPDFKAAVHMGNVVVGEIGVIKKDIVYAGDVLNSTSRILDLSKRFGEQLLVSDLIYEKLGHDTRFTFQFLDALILRGKTTETKVFTVKVNR